MVVPIAQPCDFMLTYLHESLTPVYDAPGFLLQKKYSQGGA